MVTGSLSIYYALIVLNLKFAFISDSNENGEMLCIDEYLNKRKNNVDGMK